MRRVRHLRPCPPPHGPPQPTRQSGSRPYVSGDPRGARGRPPGHPVFPPTGSRPICEEFPARQVKSALHLDNGHTGRFGPLPHEPTAGQGPLRCISTTKALAHRFTS